MSDWFDEVMRLRHVTTRRISEKQLEALQLIADKKVRVEWGMTTEKLCPVTNNTLWSLELRGLAKMRSEPGIVQLTDAGKQIVELVNGR